MYRFHRKYIPQRNKQEDAQEKQPLIRLTSLLQLAIAEQVLLMGVGGVFCSALLSPLLLALSQQGRRFMSKAATWCSSQG